MIQLLVTRKGLSKVVNIEKWSKKDKKKFYKAYTKDKGYKIKERRI